MIKKLKALALAAVGLCGFISMSASAEWLKPGQVLQAGQSLASHDGRYRAILQGDGNFVVYRLADGVAIWNTGTDGSGATWAVMQTDGNFVIYTADGKAVWWTATSNQDRALQNEFTVDDEGRAAVVAYLPVWSAGSNVSGLPPADNLYFQSNFAFQQGVTYNGPNGTQWTFQADGNLVLYRNGQAIWASNVTQNKKGGRATYAEFSTMLFVWNDAGQVFSTGSSDEWIYPPGFHQLGTSEHPDYLKLGNDNVLFVIQSDANAMIWTSTLQWGAAVYDPQTTTAPGGDGPVCVGDPNACFGGGTIPVVTFPF